MPSAPAEWTLARIRNLVSRKFGKRPCLWQLKVAQSLRDKKRNDVVAVAATGCGKTLSFWIGLLMALEDGEDKVVIVVTPLNLLGRQNAEGLRAAGMSAIAVDAQNCTDDLFRDIKEGLYQIIVLGPEVAMMEGGQCEKLWQDTSFTSKILYIVFDEAHCISEWSSFREQYKYLGSLRYLLSLRVPFYLPSATLPAAVLSEVSDTMHLRNETTEYILRSNDRPEIALAVRPMQHPIRSFKDLDFLIPHGFQEGDTPPPKFLIFFNSVKEAEDATIYLRARLPQSCQGKVKWFHATMTAPYREDEFEGFKDGETFGLCVTDSFGMGLDIADIELIVQWRVPVNMNTLWQRFGRGARGNGRYAFAILLVEKEYTDEERERKAVQAAKRKNQPARKRKQSETVRNAPSKRPALAEVAIPNREAAPPRASTSSAPARSSSTRAPSSSVRAPSSFAHRDLQACSTTHPPGAMIGPHPYHGWGILPPSNPFLPALPEQPSMGGFPSYMNNAPMGFALPHSYLPPQFVGPPPTALQLPLQPPPLQDMRHYNLAFPSVAAMSGVSGHPVASLREMTAIGEIEDVEMDEGNEADGEPDRQDTEAHTAGEQTEREVERGSEAGTERALTDEDRRASYNKRPFKPLPARASTTKETRSLPPVLDDFINAKRRSLGCRRKVVDLYYSNDKRSFDHNQCNPSVPSGCSRCSPKLTLVCCDVCTPLVFSAIFDSPTATVVAPRKMKKSHIPPYDPSASCRALRDALFDWRDERTAEDLGDDILEDYGGCMILPVQSVTRIVDCAQAGKLQTLDNLKREIVWTSDHLERYGQSLLAVIHSIFPPPPAPAAAQAAPSSSSAPPALSASLTNNLSVSAGGMAEASSSSAKRIYKCGLCKQTGHNRRRCPTLTGFSIPDENTPPAGGSHHEDGTN